MLTLSHIDQPQLMQRVIFAIDVAKLTLLSVNTVERLIKRKPKLDQLKPNNLYLYIYIVAW